MKKELSWGWDQYRSTLHLVRQQCEIEKEPYNDIVRDMRRGLVLSNMMYWSSKSSDLTELVASLYSNKGKFSIFENFISLVLTKRRLVWRLKKSSILVTRYLDYL